MTGPGAKVSSNYAMSFTAGGLFYPEAIKAAELYQTAPEWDAVKVQLLTQNLLQLRTQSSLRRIVHELILRLQSLTPSEVTVLVDGTRPEQTQVLWLAACKQYPFVRAFAMEVIREKYLHLDFEMSYLDFDVFYNAQAEWVEALEKLTDSTRKKIRQVLFLMLTEAEIISPANFIQPALLSARMGQVILEDDPAYFSVFPISDADIRKLTKP